MFVINTIKFNILRVVFFGGEGQVGNARVIFLKVSYVRDEFVRQLTYDSTK